MCAAVTDTQRREKWWYMGRTTAKRSILVKNLMSMAGQNNPHPLGQI